MRITTLALAAVSAAALLGCENANAPDSTILPQLSSTAIADAVDQEQLNHQSLAPPASDYAFVGQTFTPAVNNLTAFAFYLGVWSTAEYEFSVVHWSSGNTVTTVTAALPLGWGWKTVHLPTPVALIPGHKYGLLINRTSSGWLGLYLGYAWYGAPDYDPDLYPGGKFCYDGGGYCRETWQSDLKRGFKECWRVLEDYGTLIFKWSDSEIPFKKM